MSGLRLSVIVPFYNRSEVIELCLQSLLASEYPNFEVIAVDDGSTDDAAALVRKYPVRLVQLPRNLGAGCSRNEGAKVADGDVLVFVDSDVVVTANVLGLVAADFETRPQIAAVQSIYAATCRYDGFVSAYSNVHYHFYGVTIPKVFLSTVATYFVAVRSSVFKAVGMFDDGATTARYVGEDQFFGYKFDQETQKIYLDKRIMVEHLKQYGLCSYLRHDIQTGNDQVRRILGGKLGQFVTRVGHGEVGTLIPSSFMYSVILAFTIFLNVGLCPFFPALAVWPLAAQLIVFYWLNGRFLLFTRRTCGWWFFLRSALLTYFKMFFVGLGCCKGVLGHVLRRPA